MIIYVPRLIESAEQAEALPVRTPVLMGPFVAYRPFAGKGWVVTDAGGEYSSEELIAAHAHLTPTALTPIEVEEEWTAMGSDHGDPWIAHIGHDGIDGSREEAQWYVDRFGGSIARSYRTPWEEAQ